MARKKKKGKKTYFDYSLLFAIIVLTAFGLVMIYSSSSYIAQVKFKNHLHFVSNQFIFVSLGFLILLIVSRIDYHIFIRLSEYLYWISAAMVWSVMFIGTKANGKRRWFKFGPINIQPSEIAKIALIIFLAMFIVKCGKEIDSYRKQGCILFYTCFLALPVAIVNLSSAIIIAGITYVMTYIACKKNKFHILIAALAVVIYSTARYWSKFLVVGYRGMRVLAWQDPEKYASDSGYQILQGLYALGSGGMRGKGLGESLQKFSLPEAQNDMIFAIIGEELGLFGMSLIILIFVFMIYRMVQIANNAKDLHGSLLVIGIIAQISIQVILNIAVVTNSIPNTGITLPFISYGGSALLILFGEMGIVFSVGRQILIEDEQVNA